MWKNVGQIQWRLNTYFTQTMDTGPSADHTTGKGKAKNPNTKHITPLITKSTSYSSDSGEGGIFNLFDMYALKVATLFVAN